MPACFARHAQADKAGVLDRRQGSCPGYGGHRAPRLRCASHQAISLSRHMIMESNLYAIRTTANREDQVMDFIVSNAKRKKLEVYAVIRPRGMRGYIFLEAGSRSDAEQAAFGVPYARGVLPNTIEYKEVEHMLEQVKHEINIQKQDIVEIISGPFKRENAKVTRIDKQKEEVVVELLESAVPIPITVKMAAVRVTRRESAEPEEEEADEGDDTETFSAAPKI